VTGTIHSLLLASNRLFVVTLEGSIYCLGPDKTAAHTYQSPVLDRAKAAVSQTTPPKIASVISDRIAAGGYVFLAGIPDGKLIDGLLAQIKFRLLPSLQMQNRSRHSAIRMPNRVGPRLIFHL